MRSLGICTKRRHVDGLNYEKRQLYEAARARYDRVLLIDPADVAFSLIRGEAAPRLAHRGEDLSTLSTLVVRSTGGREGAIAILARALRLCGCDVLDPVERFSVGTASKLLTTLTRFQSGAGSSSYFAFRRQVAAELLVTLEAQRKLPLVTKPVAGRKGRGVYLIESVDDGMRRLNDHFGPEEYADEPFFLQDRIDVVKEYRILVMDGEALGVAEKISAPGGLAANAAQGARFVAADAPGVVVAALPHVSGEGILGVDVAVDTAGSVHVIEANRAPEWEAFERATGMDVAHVVVDRAVRRLGGARAAGDAGPAAGSRQTR